ncbi:hypothetical protein M569_05132, partial [Genlisea aurea]
LLFFGLVISGFLASTTTTRGDGAGVVTLSVNTSAALSKKISDVMYGVFFEEINHAGAGGLWAELVSNRGFESGAGIHPWEVIGDSSFLNVSTDLSSNFTRNPVALKVKILCHKEGLHACPPGGVGVYNPGFWGMNIEQGKSYTLVFYIRSIGAVDLVVSLATADGSQILASSNVKSSGFHQWSKVKLSLVSRQTDRNSRLQFTVSKESTIWLDQVSLMPADTHKGHGFRTDLFDRVQALKPTFLRFPGGCFVEGQTMKNAVRWKETIGAWEERPGHYGDVWGYWTDDGLGHLEYLQLAEDLGALPVWVFNNGISLSDEVDLSQIQPFIQEALDGIEFARGDGDTKWGKVRSDLGHPQPFDLRYVAVGNEECWLPHYSENYRQFYAAIKKSYPDIKIINNCDYSSSDNRFSDPADLYDFHIYTSAKGMFDAAHHFDGRSGDGPKAFVSEFAVYQGDGGNGTLLAALGEAAFLIGLENNCHAVEMASYAPLLVNTNDRKWTPDAIVFDAYRSYGTPSYWVQREFFVESSGALLLEASLGGSENVGAVVANAVAYVVDGREHVKIKVVNFGSDAVEFRASVGGGPNGGGSLGATKTVLTSAGVTDENSFSAPENVVPVRSESEMVVDGGQLNDVLTPHSLTSFDLESKSN